MDSNVINNSTPLRQSISSAKAPGLQIAKVEDKNADVSQSKLAPKIEAKEIDQKDINERLKNSVSRLNSLVKSAQRDLQFSIDDNSGETVITVLDSSTEKVIRQIPSEEVLALSNNIETLKGVLFSAEV